MLHARGLKIGMYLALVLALAGSVHAQSLVDTFEASTINPLFWTSSQQYGRVRLSTDVNKAFGGKRSLKVHFKRRGTT